MKKVIKESILGGPVKPNIKVELKNKLNSNSAVSVVKSINHPNLAYEMENFVLNKFIKSEKILPRQLMKNSYIYIIPGTT